MRTPIRIQNEVDAVDVGGPIYNRVIVVDVSLDVEIGHVRTVVLRGVAAKLNDTVVRRQVLSGIDGEFVRLEDLRVEETLEEGGMDELPTPL